MEAFLPPPPARRLLPPLLHPGLGAGGGSSPQDAAAAPLSGGVAGVAGVAAPLQRQKVGVWSKFRILLVLELALDNLGHGPTAGALNPLDVLVLVGCQVCLQLRVCYLKESGFIWVYASSIALSC